LSSRSRPKPSSLERAVSSTHRFQPLKNRL
jgi:hypothetical protein